MKQPTLDKLKAVKDAKEIHFTCIWQDESGKWRPCKDINSAPFYCIAVENLNNVNLKPALDRLRKGFK